MQIRQLNVSDADKLSALVFFKALFSIYELRSARVLDAFARNGQLTVNSYRPYLADPDSQLECWELSGEHKEALEKLTVQVKIGCSYDLSIQAVKDKKKYELVVVDTPQGMHKTAQDFLCCEHFDFLSHALNLLADKGVVVLYVNKHPYDRSTVGSHGYDEYVEYNYKQWMTRRWQFYGFERANEADFIDAYTDLLIAWGWQVKSLISIPCFSDVPGIKPYAFRLGLQLSR